MKMPVLNVILKYIKSLGKVLDNEGWFLDMDICQRQQKAKTKLGQGS